MENPYVKARAVVALVRLFECGIIETFQQMLTGNRIHEVSFWPTVAGGLKLALGIVQRSVTKCLRFQSCDDHLPTEPSKTKVAR